MLLTVYQHEYLQKRMSSFGSSPASVMSNLGNGKIILKFNKSVLVQQNSFSLYSIFILNLYMVYNLNNWSRNFTFKKCLFGTLKLARNAIKSKFI